MAKSKNHTNHNQNYKAHRNGIKRPKFGTKVSTKGVSFLSYPLRKQTEAVTVNHGHTNPAYREIEFANSVRGLYAG